MVILVTALMVLAFAYFEVNLPDASVENPLGGNIIFFLLININIILNMEEMEVEVEVEVEVEKKMKKQVY